MCVTSDWSMKDIKTHKDTPSKSEKTLLTSISQGMDTEKSNALNIPWSPAKSVKNERNVALLWPYSFSSSLLWKRGIKRGEN